MTRHMAWVREPFAGMLARGEKRVEGRLSVTRAEPHGVVGVGDTVYFKRSGGGVFLRTRVERVDAYEALDARGVSRLRREYGRLCDPSGSRAGERFWSGKSGARYATFIWVSDAVVPRRVPDVPRQYGRAWLRLG